MSALEAPTGQEIGWPEARQESVLEKCGEDVGGQWCCLTCQEWFPHNMAMQTHSESGDHMIGWRCFAHGIETP